MPRRILSLACGLLAAIAYADGPPHKPGFHDRTIKDADGAEAKYILFVPHKYDKAKPGPVVLYLHGAGETGDDGKKMMKNGLPAHIKKHEADYPFITVIPQSQKRSWQADGPDAQRAIKILDHVMKEYNGDPSRVYLTGLSMGGFGTWSLATKYPERWAAIAPICGGGDPKAADKIKSIPCWCFHGADDPTVNVSKSRDMIAALKAAGGSPKYDEYPGVKHDSWTKAYATKELYTWFLEHKKS